MNKEKQKAYYKQYYLDNKEKDEDRAKGDFPSIEEEEVQMTL